MKPEVLLSPTSTQWKTKSQGERNPEAKTTQILTWEFPVFQVNPIYFLCKKEKRFVFKEQTNWMGAFRLWSLVWFGHAIGLLVVRMFPFFNSKGLFLPLHRVRSYEKERIQIIDVFFLVSSKFQRRIDFFRRITSLREAATNTEKESRKRLLSFQTSWTVCKSKFCKISKWSLLICGRAVWLKKNWRKGNFNHRIFEKMPLFSSPNSYFCLIFAS